MSTKEKDDNGDHVPVSRLWETAISIAHCAWNSWTSLKSLWLNNPCLYLSPSLLFFVPLHFLSLFHLSFSLSSSFLCSFVGEGGKSYDSDRVNNASPKCSPLPPSRYCKTFPADLLLQLQPFFSETRWWRTELLAAIPTFPFSRDESGYKNYSFYNNF